MEKEIEIIYNTKMEDLKKDLTVILYDLFHVVEHLLITSCFAMVLLIYLYFILFNTENIYAWILGFVLGIIFVARYLLSFFLFLLVIGDILKLIFRRNKK